MISACLQKAIDNLEILDVNLDSCRSYVASSEDFDFREICNSEKAYSEFQLQYAMNHKSYRKIRDEFLLVDIFFGARVVKTQKDQGSLIVGAKVEATYSLKYLIKGGIDEECFEEFSEKNAIYHAWPYWREFLSSQSLRLGIPKLVMPARQLDHHRLESEESFEGD